MDRVVTLPGRSEERTLSLTIPVAPVAKPRMTQRDQWRVRPAVQRYRDFCDAARLVAMRDRFELPQSGALIVFRVPMPPSWPKKRRHAMDGQPHQQRPDLDNMLKAVADALLPEDSALWQVTAEKRWSTEGRVEIYTTHTESS